MLVVLNILKIIGIVLLVILGIILLVLLLVLFVPVRYKLDANVPETELDNGIDVEKMYFSAKFHWLLHIVRGGIEFPENKEFYLKVLWLTILPAKSDIKKKKNEDEESSSEEEKTEHGVVEMSDMGDEGQGQEEIAAEETTETETEESAEVEASAEAEVQVEAEAQESETKEEPGSEASEESEESEDEDEKKNLIEILSDIFEKIEKILKTPQNVFEKIQYTISRVCDKIGMIKRTIDNDIFKRAFKLVKAKLLKIIRMILPDKCDINVLFGTGDPADTASVMAAYSAMYPVLYNKVKYQPDFERKVIMADAHLKGHITVFTILYSVLRCYFDKDVKKVIKRFKKIFKS
jgi:hypothetical protein